MHLTMADQGGSSGSSVMRDYRKGNWTVSETMVLIEAKKMDDERRMKRSTGESSSEGGRSSNKPTELRWKWVEDYCWRKGCLRSQNQCNDKWDNLMRDYKKVKDYERRIGERSGGGGGDGNTSVSTVEGSYWKLEKNERKDKNLPSNMLPQIYQALVEVVERKGTHHKIVNIGGGGGSLASNPNIGYLVQPSLIPLLQHHQVSASIPLSAFPPPLPQPPPPPPIAQVAAPLLHPHPHQSLPTILIQVNIRTRLQRGGEEEEEVVVVVVVVAEEWEQAHQVMKWEVQSPRVLP
ncbi:uncharacterized protein LOC120003323 isoform X2 [Tripterygium wilfordii]|uniref:uncharacterized protein LOC120003323 isoform X2 n=1 Tax=Tripterygium wilfordii TaxID=458696 RepID=UPI0018F82D04|nr:uncharacterized protein LOC120003323 isoform X2 [Tripterygium wilfordii]